MFAASLALMAFFIVRMIFFTVNGSIRKTGTWPIEGWMSVRCQQAKVFGDPT